MCNILVNLYIYLKKKKTIPTFRWLTYCLMLTTPLYNDVSWIKSCDFYQAVLLQRINTFRFSLFRPENYNHNSPDYPLYPNPPDFLQLSKGKFEIVYFVQLSLLVIVALTYNSETLLSVLTRGFEERCGRSRAVAHKSFRAGLRSEARAQPHVSPRANRDVSRSRLRPPARSFTLAWQPTRAHIRAL